MPATVSRKNVLPVIVFSQFAGTSLWFAGNAVLPELIQSLPLSQYAVSQVTAAVTLGFIAGTLMFAFFSLSDRFSPVKLFFISAILGAITNLSVVWLAIDGISLFMLRFLTGFFIAGIYPVGMKIAADWYEKGLGKAMGFLLGALVLGTAFPHLLKNRVFDLPWKTVLYYTSFLAIIGGAFMVLFVGNGPFRRKSGGFQWNAFKEIFSSKKWRQAAFGYFGHMWELYSFWGFLPLILGLYAEKNGIELNIPLLSFLIIGCGCISCIAGGFISVKTGSSKVATIALFTSGICCLISPFIYLLPQFIFLVILIIWGLAVIPDSPQFSTLVALYAPEHLKGTALTLYNAIGFSIAAISLFATDRLFYSQGVLGQENTMLILGAGAMLGLPGMIRLIRTK